MRAPRSDGDSCDDPISRTAIVGSILTSLAAGVGLGLLWRAIGPEGAFAPGLSGHGPDRAAWPRLLAVWLPAGQMLFAAAYVLLERRGPRPGLRRAFLQDQAVSVAAALLAAGTLAAMRGHPAVRDALAAWYVLAVAAKTALLLRATWRWMAEDWPGARRATAALVVGALLPYLLLGAHVVAAMSSTSDEPYYLLVTHSLLHERDVDLTDNFARADYLPFYWGRLTTQTPGVGTTDDGRIYARAFQGLQPVWLLPGYVVAGRAGAAVAVSLATALALGIAFRLALLAGASPRAAFLAWMGAAFSVPIVSFAASPWPEMTGALFATAAALLLFRAPTTRRSLAAAGLLVALMVATKTRLFLLAVPLIVGFARRVGARALTALGAVAGAAVVAVSLYDATAQGGLISRRIRATGLPSTLAWLLSWTVQAPTEYRGHLGLLLDQEFGLLTSAPFFALALAGVVAAARDRRWRLVLLIAGPFLVAWYYLGAVALIRGRVDQHWHGGFSPPARFVAAALPLLAVGAATLLDRVRGRLAWALVAALYAITLSQTLLVSLHPAWRFQRGVGRAAPLAAVFARTGLDTGRLLPSYVSPGEAWVVPGLAVLAVIAAGGWRVARGAGGPPPSRTWLLGGAAAAVLAVAWFAALWLRPTGTYPAVLGRGHGGTAFHGVIDVETTDGAGARERLVWAAREPGAIDLAPRLGPGGYRVVVRAGAQGAGEPPTIQVRLNGRAGEPMRMDAATAPRWREGQYVAEIAWAGGRLPIRIELGDVSARAPRRLAYIREIEVTALGRAAVSAMAAGGSP